MGRSHSPPSTLTAKRRERYGQLCRDLVIGRLPVILLFPWCSPQKWAVIAKAQLKKVTKLFNQYQRKAEAAKCKEVCLFVYLIMIPNASAAETATVAL